MSIINDAIYIAHMNNYTSNSNLAFKISGKGLYDFYRFDNNYNSNGIGFRLISNLDNNREFAIVDTLNSNNPSLNFNFQPSQISIKSQNLININSNIFITSNNRIGIGTINPISTLHLYSSNDCSLSITNNFPNIFTISKIGSHINISNFNGYIGIGTTNPQNFLDIRGDVIIPNSKLGIGTTNPISNLHVIGDCLITSNLNLSNLILNGKIYNGDGTPFLNSQWSNIYDIQNNSSNIYFNTGYVGIGTTNPRNLLDVSGRIACIDINIGGSILTKSIIEGTGTSADIINTGILKVLYGGTGINTFNSNQLLIGNGTNPLIQSSNLIWSNNSLLIGGDIYISSNCYINSNMFINGKIGIGTTNPLSSIHIESGINDSAIIRIGDIYLNKEKQNFIMTNNIPNGKIIIGNLTINSNGFIGIGTTNPTSNLDVFGDVNINGILDMKNSNISNANIINTKTLNISNINIDNLGTFLKKDGTPFYASRWTPNGNNIYFNSGFVGIGTTNPLFNLDIYGNVNINGILDMKNSNISNVNIINSKTLNISNILIENTGTILRKDGTPFYASRWSSNLNINNNIFYNSGFVGIGTTNPQYPLDVIGNVSIKGVLDLNNSNISNALFINTKTLSISNIILENTGVLTRADGTIIGSSPFIVSSINPNNIYFNLGNIGIGTTNPQSTLDVVGNINITGNIKYQNSNIFTFTSNFDTNPFSSNLIPNNSNYINFIGNVGIGNTITSSNLFLYGNSYIRGTQYIQPNTDGSAMVFYFNSNNLIPQNVNNNYNIFFKLGSISSNIINPFLTVYNRYQTSSSYNSAVKIEGSNGNYLLIDGGSADGIGKISFSTNNIEVMNMNSNIINIGNCLDITGNSGTTLNNGGAYITSTQQGTFLSGYSNTPAVFSLRTTDNIICGKNSYALSDIRIKTNINDINDNEALLKIMRIEPKTYNYIDTIQRTSSNVYGFIAQQIREVIPEAVEIISKFIPNIYKLVPINNNKFILDDNKDLKIDDILQIYTLNSIEETKILEINQIMIDDIIKYEFIIDKYINDNEIFIYGSYVKDFHILDKSYLYTLNICATQQIYKDICLLSSNLDYKSSVIR